MTTVIESRPEDAVQALQRTEALLEAGLHEVRALVERLKADARLLPQPSATKGDSMKTHLVYVACIVLGAAGPSLVRWVASLVAG